MFNLQAYGLVPQLPEKANKRPIQDSQYEKIKQKQQKARSYRTQNPYVPSLNQEISVQQIPDKRVEFPPEPQQAEILPVEVPIEEVKQQIPKISKRKTKKVESKAEECREGDEIGLEKEEELGCKTNYVNQGVDHKIKQFEGKKTNFKRTNLKRGYKGKTMNTKNQKNSRFFKKGEFSRFTQRLDKFCEGVGKDGLDGPSTSSYMAKRQSEVTVCFSKGCQLSRLRGKENHDEQSITSSYLFQLTEEEIKTTPEVIEGKSQVLSKDMSKEEHEVVLQKYFGFSHFKEGQYEAIQSLLNGNSTLAVLSTGGGKSLIYQYSSLFLEGVVLVISPLLALMSDQILKMPIVLSAACINSQQTPEQKRHIEAEVREGRIKILMVSPERLLFQSLKDYQVGLVCVDEAHCYSQWSHNFRPAYLKLFDIIKKRVRNPLILGLTATATKQTKNQVCDALFINKHEQLLVGGDSSNSGLLKKGGIVSANSFVRQNLELHIMRLHKGLHISSFELKLKQLRELLFSKQLRGKSILIYCTTKSATFDLKNKLQSLAVECYNASMSSVERQQIQRRFQRGQTKIIVATVAFSMGIDKSDIHAVIHFDMPKSFESYVQEIGRAGRNGAKAYCYLFIEQDSYFTLRNMMLLNYFDREVVESILYCLRRKVEQQEADLDSKYVYLNAKELCNQHNLKHQVLTTLFTYLSHQVPLAITYLLDMSTHVVLNFYSSLWEEKAKESESLLFYMAQVWKKYSANYHVDIPELCALQDKYKPYDILKELYYLQSQGILGYEVLSKNVAFVLQKGTKFEETFKGKHSISAVATKLLERLNRVEHLQIQKLRAFYKVCDMVGLRKNQKELMNKFIDLYYHKSTLDEFNQEVDEEGEDSSLYLPILDVDEETSAEIKKDVRSVFEDEEKIDPKSIEIKQVLIGIWQDWRKNGGDGRYAHFNKKYQEYDYKQVMEVVDEEFSRIKSDRALREVLIDGA